MHRLYFIIGVSWIAFWVYWIAAAVRTGLSPGRPHDNRRAGQPSWPG